MILFVKFLIAHIIGDFILQSNAAVKDKEEKKHKSPKLYLHILIHGILSFFIVWTTDYLMGICIIMFLHFLIDLWKLTFQNDSNSRYLFLADQMMHLIVLLVVSDYYAPFVQTLLTQVNSSQMFLLVLAILLTTIVTSHVVRIVISKWAPENEDTDEDSLSDAGSYIGMLERLFVFGFIISGNIQLIGFLLAAKSVFRFGDLKDAVDRKLTEYILIGTLISFGVAILIGQSYLFIVEML